MSDRLEQLAGDVAALHSKLILILLHHAVVIPIEGNSYRLREHAELIPEHLRSRPLHADPNTPPRRRPGRPRKEVSPSLPA